jgi:hypothetical protein
MAISQLPHAPPLGTPTRVRYWVIFYAVTLAVVTYIDRVAISKAAKDITGELGLTTVQMGAAFSAFASIWCPDGRT